MITALGRKICRFLFAFSVALTAIFFVSVPPVLAGIEITSLPQEITIGEEFAVGVSLTNVSGSHYLGIGVHKSSGDEYFGLTKNGSDWVEMEDGNCASLPEISTIPWSGDLTGKVVYGEKGFDDSLGNYLLRIIKYTYDACHDGKSKSYSEEVVVNLTGTSSPTPTSASTSCSSDIVLSEFIPNPEDDNEWVELKNNSGSEIILTNWQIDDMDGGGQSPRTFSATIGAGSYYKYDLGNGFLNDDNDEVRLLCPDGSLRESTSYSYSNEGVSWIKSGSGWCESESPTPGGGNSSCRSSGDSDDADPTPTPTPTPTSTPTPTPEKTPTPTPGGEVLGEETDSQETYLLESPTPSPAEEEGAGEGRGLPVIFLISGLVFLFSGGLWLWYTLKEKHVLS